ncbi:MAG: YdcF family protein [Bacteroidia bacterium]
MKNAKKRKYFIAIWLVMTFVLTNNFILSKCLEKYETSYHPIAEGKVYDCAIVLGGASSYDSFSRLLQLSESAERLTEPVILYKKGIVKKLLISGGSASVFPPFIKDAIYVRRFWLDMGVPDKDIIIESESRNTIENAKFSKELLQKKAIGKNVLLITSALHMPRSKYIFNKMGMLPDIYPVDFKVKRIVYDKYNLGNYFLPKTSALEGWEALIHEWVGMLSARI